VIRRALLALAILPLSAWAQLQVFQFDGVTDQAVGAVCDVGSASPGDTIETRFHVRNIGAGPATFDKLSLAGAGFRISAWPSLPYILAPAAQVEFKVAFQPDITGTFNAFLAVNTINVILRGTSTPAVTLMLAGSKTPIMAGAVIDFGSVTRGASHSQGFSLWNNGSAALTIATLSVGGVGFRGPLDLTAPVQLAPGQTKSFEIAFEPQSGTLAQGTLTVDKRSFSLKGQGLDPPLPSASITLASTVGASAQQNSLSIPLSAASQVSGTGTLTMEFQSGVAGVTDDPAIQFLSGPKRAATVTVSPGDSAAKFGTQSSLAFQTGTTAGTILFTLKLGNTTQQATLNITPAPVKLDRATGVRRIDALDVSLIGFDNTYSTSQLAFTFYNSAGQALQPGAMQVDASSQFRKYFATTATGGSFALLASFPVIGDTSQISAVDVQITNSAGVVAVQRIAF
jgi:hypothetical protein